MAITRSAASLTSMPLPMARLPRRHSARRTGQGFGRRCGFVAETPEPATPALGQDLKLFLTTFAAGFLFVSVFIG